MVSTAIRSTTTSARVEAARIRNQLAVRWNHETNTHEVFTTIHGTGVFRWYKVTEEVARWYCQQFGLTMTTTEQQQQQSVTSIISN